LETISVCVDTDIVIDYLRGKHENQNILPMLIEKYYVYISPISVYELYYGGFYSGKVKSVEDVLSMMTPFDWSVEDSKRAAQLHASLPKSGETLSVKDVLVAGPCIAKNVPLVTRNVSHFRRIKGLKVIDGTKYLKT